MYRNMKKTALILAVFLCFLSCQSLKGGSSDKSKPKPEENNATAEAIKRIDGEISKINGEIRRLNEGNSGRTDHGNQSSSPSASNTIPVTPKIIEALLQQDGSSDGLKFYLSKPFTMKIYEQNETAAIEIKPDMVIINSNNPPNEKEIEFSRNSEGTFKEFSGPGADISRELRIFFQEQGKTLVFSRRQNSYELSSVIDKKPFEIKNSEHIQLYVSGVDNRKTEVHVTSADFAYPDNQAYQKVNTGGFNNDFTSSASPSRRIMGNGSVSPARVKEYVRTKKSLTNRDIAIIDKYFEEARFEGVNVDIAIAQMLYWTNNLRNNERVNSCNYGGLSPLPQKNFYGSFSSMTIGVRAHIQHLKAYANVRLNQNLVDPRYSLAVERGFTGITFDQVYRSWSASPRYGQEIDIILRNLYR